MLNLVTLVGTKSLSKGFMLRFEWFFGRKLLIILIDKLKLLQYYH